MKIQNNLFIACCVGVGLALLPMPYLFYILLRILFFVSIVYYFIAIYNNININIKIIILIILAILYNPFIVVHLGGKLLWTIVNIATLFFMYTIKGKMKL